MKNDDAFANSPYIAGGEAWFDTWADKADQFRRVEAAIGRARLNQSYGAGERERFDLFHPAGRAHGLVVFIHGGYWRRFGREYFSHCAAGAAARGWAVALPSYTLAPDATIPEMTLQIARALEAAAALVAGPLVITGHSAGGHLSARMVCPDVALSPALLKRIKRVVPISPVADLRPLIETTMNADLHLDEATAIAESPALVENPRAIDCEIWVGGDERPIFIEQAHALNAAWSMSRLVVDAGRHHFDVVDGLERPDGGLTHALLKGLV